MKCSSLISVAALATSSSISLAGLVAVGDGREHGSWVQQFQENGVTFDHMQIVSLSGPPFEIPTTFQNFTDGGWGQTYDDGIVAVADGGALNNLLFDIIFSGNQADPFTFAFQAYDGQTLVDDAFVHWTGGNFIIFGGSGLPDSRVTPTPGALALLGIGGLTMARRRR